MAQFRVWPSKGGAAPPDISISCAQFHQLQLAAGVTFDREQRRALIDACNRFVDQADLQAGAEAAPAEVREWLQAIQASAAKLQRCLRSRRSHAAEVAAIYLGAEMDGDRYRQLLPVIGETVRAAKSALESTDRFVTDAKDDALGEFARRVAQIVQSAGLKPSTAGADYHYTDGGLPADGEWDGCSSFVAFFERLITLLPVPPVAKTRNALAKKLQRILPSRTQST